MIIIHEPEQLARCHQTWICEVEVYLPDSDKGYVFTVERGGWEQPLSARNYFEITATAVRVAQRAVEAITPERKP